MKKALVASMVLGSLLFTSFAFAATPPSLVVTGGSVPFSTISVAGTGFTPSETVHVMLGLNSVDVTADATGAFANATLTIPNLPAGLYPVIAVGQGSGTVAFSYLYVQSLYPLANPSSWYIAPGSTISWTGSAFIPNEVITIMLGSTTAATFHADSNGAFSSAGASVVPFALRNSTATYTLSSAQSGVHTNFNIAVANLYPYVNPSTWYALPGTPVTFSGAGFGPGESVSVFLGASTTPLADIPTDSTGSFTTAGSTILPFHTGSPVVYRLVGDQSGATTLAPITLAQFYPSLNPSAYYSAPGSFISLSGTGFVPNELVDVTVGSGTSTQATTDGTGAFTLAMLHMPTAPNTTATVSATGETSGAHSAFVMAIGAYYSWITLSNYWAQGGSPLSIFGHNFAGGETVTITSGSATLGTATAGNDGSFTAPLAVPFMPSGPATITATGNTSGASAIANMTVAPVYTDLQLGSYAGAPGAHVEFIGHGYLPNEPVVVTTDRTGTTQVATFNADAGGNFDDSSYVIPSNFIEGNLTLTASGQHSFDSKSITYYVTGQ